MHSPVTAIRAGLARPRFAPPQPHHRERHLGLAGRSLISAATTGPACSSLHPRAAVRGAARSLVRPAGHARPATLTLRRSAQQVSWSRRTVDGLRAAREGSAAAWRA